MSEKAQNQKRVKGTTEFFLILVSALFSVGYLVGQAVS
jgi:hypothetical protein